jgi:FlaA1/EpsC-like NDP-sugar epimerase
MSTEDASRGNGSLAETPDNPTRTSEPGILIRYRMLLRIVLLLGLFAVSLFGSLALRYDFRFVRGLGPSWVRTEFLPTLPILLAIKGVVFAMFGLYRSSWRYVGFRDILRIVTASYVGTFIFVPVFLTIQNFTDPRFFGGFPQSVIVLDLIATISLVGIVSIVVRFYHEEYLPLAVQRLIRLLIVGAGDAGEAALREIQRMDVVLYDVVGFLDDNPRKLRARIHGVEVLGDTSQVREFCERHAIDEVLLAIPSAPQRIVRGLVERCHGTQVRFRTVPALGDLIAGRVRVSQMRNVDIEDLLGREAVTLDDDAIAQYLRDKVVLVTGAGGSIGAEMCRQIARVGPQRLILVEQTENNLFTIERDLLRSFDALPLEAYVADICDAERIEHVFAAEQPAAVFHAAAHKHVPMMERNVGEAIKNNVGGTRTLADAAVRAGVRKFVMISTDKAVNPTSVMGCAKRVAELYVQQLSARGATKFVTVRFGNVLGSSGSVVPIFKAQIERGGPVTVTHPEMTRYFMTIPEAAQLVLQAGAIGDGGEIFLLDMGEPVKIVDLARDLITLSGLKPDTDIEIQFTGVRPGEKLFEELSVSGENILTTSHPKIGVWEKRAEDFETVVAGVEDLLAMAEVATADALRQRLAELVPEYQPNPNGSAGNDE